MCNGKNKKKYHPNFEPFISEIIRITEINQSNVVLNQYRRPVCCLPEMKNKN